jgi:hypothetical protein
MPIERANLRRWLPRGVRLPAGIGWPWSLLTTPRVLEEPSLKGDAAVISQKRCIIHMSFGNKDLPTNYVPFDPSTGAAKNPKSVEKKADREDVAQVDYLSTSSACDCRRPPALLIH